MTPDITSTNTVTETLAHVVHENRLRRMARRQGLAVIKSRRRDPPALGYGGYMLKDTYHDVILAGGEPYPFCLDISEVEQWLTA